MEQDQPGRSPVEVLDTGRPPGAVERWARALLARRSARIGTAFVAAVVALGAWLVLSPSGGPAGPEEDAALAGSTQAGSAQAGSAQAGSAQAGSAQGSTPGLRPPPMRGRQGASGGWKVGHDIAVRSGPAGHTVTFHAVNRSSSSLYVKELVVSGSFVDRPGLEYRGECGGVRITATGRHRIAGPVEPGRRVLVRCHDATVYQGSVAMIDLGSVVVRPRCEDEGHGSGV